MRATTNTYKQLIATNNTRKYLVKINMTLADDTELELTNEDIWADSFELETASSNTSSFDIGCAVIGKCKFQLNNFDERFNSYDFFNATAVVWLKLDGDSSYYRIGFFTVDEPSFAGALISLELLDNMWKFDVPLSEVNLTYPVTILSAVNSICSYCGVTLATQDFHGKNFQIGEPKEDMNCREFLQYVAMIGCNFCLMDSQGNLNIKWYNTSAIPSESDLDGGTFNTNTTPYSDGDTADGGNFLDYTSGDSYDGGTFTDNPDVAYFTRNYSTNLGTDVITITGLKVTIDKTEYTVGSEGYVLEINNPLITVDNVSSVLNLMWEVLEDFSFRTFSVDALSDLAVEVGDCCAVMDLHGNYAYSFVTNLSYKLTSMTATLGAVSPTRTLTKRYSKTVQQAVDQARKQTDAIISDYDVAVQMMNALAVNAMGAYQDYEDLTTGGRVYYLSNMPIAKTQGQCSFESGSVVFKISGDGFFVSQDGGTTWTNGYDPQTGNLVVNVLNAIGINAQWIKTGTLTVGGVGTDYPTIIVKDDGGHTIVTINRDGITMYRGRLQSADGTQYIDLTNNQIQLTGGAKVGNKTIDNMFTIEGRNYALGTYNGFKVVNGTVTEGSAQYNVSDTLLTYISSADAVRLRFKGKFTNISAASGTTVIRMGIHMTGILASTGQAGGATFRITFHAPLEANEGYWGGLVTTYKTYFTSITDIDYCIFDSFVSSGTIEVSEFKCELSNEYTAWSYAPEDEANLQNVIDGKITDGITEYDTTQLNQYKIWQKLTNTSDDCIILDNGVLGLRATAMQVGKLTDKYNYNYWDLDTGELKIAANAKIYDSQADYSGAYVPTNNNSPASSWNTEELKRAHLGATFLNTSNKETYIYGLVYPETSHPYESNEDAYYKFITGLTAPVKMHFNSKSETESVSYDYIDLFYLDNGTYYKRRLGGTIGGMDVVIPSGTFWLHWHTDTSVTRWGWKIDSIIETTETATGFSADSLPSATWTEITTPYEWYAASMSDYATKDLSQEEIFNILTDNGRIQGIYMQNGQLYINTEYLGAGVIRIGGVNYADNAHLEIRDTSDKVTGKWDKDGFEANAGKFGILQIDSGTAPEYKDAKLYYKGYLNLIEQEWASLSNNLTEYIYFSPYYDGWTGEAQINIDFQCLDSGSHTETVLTCRLYSWSEGDRTWSLVVADDGDGHRVNEVRTFDCDGNQRTKYSGDELPAWFYTYFTPDDKTVYRIQYVITRKSYYSDYFLQMFSDDQDVVQINKGGYSGGEFRGRHYGAGEFYSFKCRNVYVDDTYMTDQAFVVKSYRTGSYTETKPNRVQITTTSGDLIGMGYSVGSGLSGATFAREISGDYQEVKWDTGSDARIKKDIELLDTELSCNLIDRTEPKKFRYKANDDGVHYGMIAQEARVILDDLGEQEAQLERGVDGVDKRTLNYDEYIPHLINYVKELRTEINELKAELNELKEG